MDTDHNISKVILLSRKINRLCEQILSEDHLPTHIEKDILLHDIRILYELLLDIPVKKISEHSPQGNINSTVGEDLPVEPSMAGGPVSSGFPSQDYRSEQTELTEIQHSDELTHPPSSAPISMENHNQYPVSTVEKPPQPIQKSARNPLKDKLSPAASRLTIDRFTPPRTLSDKLQNQEDNSLATRLQKNKLSDIRSAIGLNDKFTFVNELFGGNNDKYLHTIDQLNQASSLDGALELIYRNVHPSDDPESKAALDRLIEIVTRKFK